MEEVVIVAALRTAVGKFGGSIAKVPAADLGAQVIKALLAATGVPGGQVSEVLMGQVLTAGCGQNPARQASIRAGIPDTVPAMTVGKVCGSGLKATHLAAQAIRCGDAQIVIAGGQENMSASPHLLAGSRDGFRMGDAKLSGQHDRRRAMGRLQQLPHGRHGGERRPPIRHLAARAGRVCRRFAAEGRGGAEGRAFPR